MTALRIPALAALLLAAPLAVAADPAVGLAGCPASPPANPTYVLTATDGYIQLPDGNTMYMWGYAPAGGGFQHPGPVLCASAGDTVTVVLRNDLAQAVSVVFPGQEGVTADGAPVQPQFTDGALTSLAQAAPPGGGTVTYRFVAGRPGTFAYHSGTDPATQVRMGLFGALVVRPAGVPLQASGRADSAFTEGEEFLVLLSGDRPAAAPGPGERAPLRRQRLPGALLAAQRARLPRHRGRQLRALAAHAALRRAGPGPPPRSGRPPAPRPHPLPEPGRGELPVPPARQQRPGDRARRLPARRGRAARTSPWRSSR
ncbi:MAG: multicopper oxidase domain-containing protein [Anaeromyxobacter sp.]